MLIAVTGLLSAAICGCGCFEARTASQTARVADQLRRIDRSGLWLYAAAGSRPRKEWQPVLGAVETEWSSLTGTAPSVAKALDQPWHALDKALRNQKRVSWAGVDKLSGVCEAEAEARTQEAQSHRSTSGWLVPAGAGGLFLCLLGSLGLSRRQRLTQFQTTQAYLAAERAAWEKQRSSFDSQRDQLIAELQQAHQHKAELDTLRQHGSRQFEEFFRTLPVACFCVAASGKIVRWNSACEALYGLPAAEVLDGRLGETIIPPEERDSVEAQMTRVLAGESLDRLDRRDRHASGALIDVRCSLAPLRDAGGRIIGVLSANFAGADLKSYEQRIETQQQSLQEMQSLLEARQGEVKTQRTQGETAAPAEPSPDTQDVTPEDRPLRDAITGLRTHGDFQEHVQVEFDRFARYNTPASLVLIDLDGFAGYNAAFGYRAGDQALRDVAEMLSTKVRSVDIVARYGADEFAILLPETGRAGALIAAERFRVGVADIAWDGRPLTASLSVAVLTTDLIGPQALVAKAAAALRASIIDGPNHTVCADGLTCDGARAAAQGAPRHAHPPRQETPA